MTRISLDARSTFARETIDRALLRNGDRDRAARHSAGMTSSSLVNVQVADWAAEAARVASNQPFELGDPGDVVRAMTDDGDTSRRSQSSQSCYATAGKVLWGQATETDRRSVIAAFALNTEVRRVEMANSFVSDAVAQAWEGVLTQNGSIASLNLESNSIASAGLIAIAAGLRTNSSLTELKLANQFVNCTQQAEEAFASALGDNHTLLKLTIDKPRSIWAHDTINKHLARNQAEFSDSRRMESRRTSDLAAVHSA